MTQHINLLPRERPSAAEGPALATVAIAAAVLLSATLAAGAWLVTQIGQLRPEAASLRAAQQARDEAASRGIPLDAALAGELAQARTRAALLGEAAARLREIDAKPSEHFSEYFAALSRQTLAGVWLTGLTVEAPARGMSISGRATSPELVPAWLRQLTREPALKDRRFAAVDLAERPLSEAGATAGAEPVPRVVEFRLQSAGRDGQAPSATSPGRGS